MTKALLTLLFTVTFVLSPIFTEPFFGFTEDQLPIPQIDPPIQPAGYTFSIWGLIYSWLIVSAVYGLWKRPDNRDWDAMRTPLIISLALGTPWLWVANQNAIAATVLIIAMAIPAILAMRRAPIADKWLGLWPCSIYAGWLTAATCVSLGATMAGYDILMDQTGWAYAGIAIALTVALTVQWRTPQAPGYGLTLIWASIGIIVANGSSLVAAEAAIGIALMAALLIAQMRQTRRFFGS